MSNLAQLLAELSDDPLNYALTMFPWGEDGELHYSKGPRKWQINILEMMTRHLQNQTTRFKPFRLAIASGHSAGKSALISMISDWALSTCVDTKIVITANTEKQLMTKTMPEVSKWFRLARNAAMFTVTASSCYSVVPSHERTWRLDALPWSENNTEAFAGLHNKGKRLLLIMDEASAISDKVWEVAEGAMTDEGTEIIWLAFGNPTRNTGRFRECFSRYKHRWETFNLDTRTVEGINQEQLTQWIHDYGEDSDFVRVRIKGEFPRAGNNQFIASNVVEDAMMRPSEAHINDPFTMSVDVARHGGDSTVISHKRGRDCRSVPWTILRGADTMEVAAKVADLWMAYKHDAVFVDGGGVGGGVVDRLRMLRVPVIEVQFGAKADRAQDTKEGAVSYANKRAEMWGYMRDAMGGLMLPHDNELLSELTSVEYGYVMRNGKDAIILEKKEDMRKRGLPSPDKADSLAMHWAYPVIPTNHKEILAPSTPDRTYDNYRPLSRDVARNIRRR